MIELGGMKATQQKIDECMAEASEHEKNLGAIKNAKIPGGGDIEELKIRFIEVKTLLEEKSGSLCSSM